MLILNNQKKLKHARQASALRNQELNKNLWKNLTLQAKLSKACVADASFKIHYERIMSVVSSYNKAVNDQIDRYDITLEKAQANIRGIKLNHLKRLPSNTENNVLMGEVRAQF